MDNRKTVLALMLLTFSSFAVSQTLTAEIVGSGIFVRYNNQTGAQKKCNIQFTYAGNLTSGEYKPYPVKTVSVVPAAPKTGTTMQQMTPLSNLAIVQPLTYNCF